MMPMVLSIVIPAHNEEANISETVTGLIEELKKEAIAYEVIIVDDNSSDNTGSAAEALVQRYPGVVVLRRRPPKGFGRAVRDGLAAATGDAVSIVMGDLSDDPKDVIRCFRKIEEGYDCVFGSRFIKGSKVKDYPPVKLFTNRMANLFIQVLFGTRVNDMTNAFKMYRSGVIKAVMPIQALYFNITVEIPLKAIIRGYSYAQIPISWYGRKSGVSKLSIKEMGRKYLFTVLYVWLEKILLDDELRNNTAAS
ncbi:MAG: glycosyltransferase [Candidatus Omnitrophota bacterium]|nr:glycosyltransferase [Candidatus Omnitrophota bacterium]